MSQAILAQGLGYSGIFTPEDFALYYAPNPFFDASYNLTTYAFLRGNAYRPAFLTAYGIRPQYRSLREVMALSWTPSAWTITCPTQFGGPLNETYVSAPRTIGGGGYYNTMASTGTGNFVVGLNALPACETPESPEVSRYDWLFYFYVVVPSGGESVSGFSHRLINDPNNLIVGEWRVICGSVKFSLPLWGNSNIPPDEPAIVTLTAIF